MIESCHRHHSGVDPVAFQGAMFDRNCLLSYSVIELSYIFIEAGCTR
jgi:hypothetical protein